MVQMASGNTARVLGYASRSGAMKATVFEVTETGSKSYTLNMLDISGNVLYQSTIVNGQVTDVQAIGGNSGCAGIYLKGFVETVLGTAAGGPVGFGVGMGMMMFDLWDNGCL